MTNNPPPPIDTFTKRSIELLRKKCLVIAKTRMPHFTQTIVLAFLIGIALSIALPSRTRTFEQSEAAVPCVSHDLGGTVTAPPSIIGFNDRLIIAVRGTAAGGYGIYANEWANGTSLTKTNASPQGWYFVNNTGNTSQQPQLTIEGGKPTILVKGAFSNGNPLDAVYKTQYVTQGAWSGWQRICVNANCAITPGPTTATLGTNSYSVSQDPADNSVLLGECQGSTALDTITVSKTFLEASPSPTDTEVELKLGSSTFTSSSNPAVFTKVSAGTYTIAFEVPPNTKAFYAICTDADTCIGGFVDSGVNTGSTVITKTSTPFTHAPGKNDFVSVVYTKTNMLYTTQIDEFRISPLVNNALAQTVTFVPVNFVWRDPIPSGGSQKSCSRKFYVADELGDDGVIDGAGDLYAQVQSAFGAWDSATIISLPFGGKHFPLFIGPVNGIFNYAFNEYDNKNTVSYTPEVEGAVGMASNYGFGPAAGVVVYGAQTDIGLAPTEGFYIGSTGPQGYFHLPTVLRHEIGHAIGFGEFDYAPIGTSIMTTPGDPANFIQEITQNDISTVNSLYASCDPAMPKRAFLRLMLYPKPASIRNSIRNTETTSSSCKNSPDPEWFSFGALIEEISGNIGVTINEFSVKYHGFTGTGGGATTDLGTFTLPFANLQGAQGFPVGTSRVEPFGELNAPFLCQVDWRPEDLSVLDLTVRGRDDNQNLVEAIDGIGFPDIVY